jgi:hypothetical protein
MQRRIQPVAVAATAEDLENGIKLTQAVNLARNGFQSIYLSSPGETQQEEGGRRRRWTSLLLKDWIDVGEVRSTETKIRSCRIRSDRSDRFPDVTGRHRLGFRGRVQNTSR